IDINGKRKDKPLTLNSDINIEMVPVVGGTFNIGSQNGPQIQLSPFSISRYEITQKQYLSVMGERNPSEFQDINCPNCPVENVTWNEAKDFTEKLSLLSDKKFRLPTEAEWEYVATGGKNRDTYTYSGTNYIDEAAWYLDNSGGTTHPVGRKVSNSLGVYDMSGNVWEWVLDWKADINLLSRVNPTGPKTGIKKVVRGCSWNDQAGGCTTFFRGECPTSTRRGLGIRVVSDY
ncbi:MAG: formylglycine-generating enzyme family protein, partial [Bacteroidota bacterium]